MEEFAPEIYVECLSMIINFCFERKQHTNVYMSPTSESLKVDSEVSRVEDRARLRLFQSPDEYETSQLQFRFRSG